jgi:hypothetical protein
MEAREEQIIVYSKRRKSRRTLPKIKIIYAMGPEASFLRVKLPESEGDH